MQTQIRVAPSVATCPNLMLPLALPVQSTSGTTLSSPIYLSNDAHVKETIVQLWTLKNVNMDLR